MYKLIAIDIDDTLITDDLIVTDGTLRALESAIEKGVTVTLATGRMYASARKIAEQMKLNVPIITYQGALVKTLLDGEVLYERNVPQEVVAAVFSFCEAQNLHLQLYVDDTLYAKEDNEKIQAYSRLSKIPYRTDADFHELVKQPQHKLLIIDEPERLDEIAEYLRPLYGEKVHITKSKPNYLEFMHKEGTKGHALAFMASYIGCQMNQTIAIGDAMNDREMVEVAGLGVAMANAVEPLKEVADFVTLSNNDEGVRHVLEKFVLV